ncbi:MAG TPA: carboxymuconolactone decarboxylase family protein [Gemmatimonadales bacterium]|jgi:alkylhydroperoxidase family enzyme
MPWIHTIDPADAEGPLKEEYDRAFQRAGRLWHILRLQSVNPAVLKASTAVYLAIMYGASPLSRGQREMLAVVVSRGNGCHY